LCVKLGHAKFQPFSPRASFSNSGLNGWGGRKNVHFQRKTGHISETINKVVYTLSDEMKIIDLG